MSWKIYFWKKSELILYLSGWWGIPLTGVNGKVEINSPSLTPSSLALGEQGYVSIHAIIWCIYILEEVYPILQAPCIEPFQDKTG